ncbi:ABC-2 type transport system permease protein [Thermomonospora echinospora]|uniref:Transport permease protein n=1 Tax=Thermomonospora echinospora TaxID=1992 RepID=A0A1H5VWR9_9ACTN|nr:ABC transporter permease [Thermomonospora echinospora]SEF91426.1 ABC-2 type transport system permease protein [Thermomonospora echinospora]
MTAVMSRPPGAVRIGLRRGLLELRLYFREREAVVFTFLMPVMLLSIFGAIFQGELGDTGVDYRQYFTAGMIASGMMSVTFVGLGVAIATERDDGTLKRLYGTPMPRSSYFIGKTLLALTLSLLETAVLFAIGATLYGVEPPADPGRWFTLGWVFVLGVAACSLLGIAMSSLPRTGRSAPAVLNLPFLALQFTSGVFVLFDSLPGWLQQVAAIFPLKWMCQGLRSALLPDTMLAMEPAGAWEHGRIALILGGWCAAGLVLCVLTFRWKGRQDG